MKKIKLLSLVLLPIMMVSCSTKEPITEEEAESATIKDKEKLFNKYGKETAYKKYNGKILTLNSSCYKFSFQIINFDNYNDNNSYTKAFNNALDEVNRFDKFSFSNITTFSNFTIEISDAAKLDEYAINKYPVPKGKKNQ